MNEKDNNKRPKSSVIFSVRDKINSDKEYYGKIYKEGKSIWRIFIACVLLALVVFAIVLLAKPDLWHKPTLQSFFGIIAQVLGAVAGIAAAVIFIILQMNIQKYGQKIQSFLIKDPVVIFYAILITATIIISSTSVLLSGKQILLSFVSDVCTIFITLELSAINLFLFILTTILLPFFIYYLIKRLSAANYLKWLYNNSLQAINKKDIENLETNLSLILYTANSGIKERDRDSIKEGIETLHDLLKFAICNQGKMHKLMLRLNQKEGMFNYKDNWFEEEILIGFESFFESLIETKQYNSAQFVIRALNSCAVENLNFANNGNLTREIIKTYKKIILVSAKEKILEEEVIRGFNSFFEKSLCLDKTEFDFLIYELFNEEFIIELIKINPAPIDRLVSEYFHNIAKRDSPFCKINKDNLVTFIDAICNVSFILGKMEKFKEIDSKLILHFNKKVSENILNISYILSLFLILKEDKENAKKCKRILNKFVTAKRMLKKIKEEVSEENDFRPRFNYLVHRLLTDVIEKNGEPERLFNKNKIIKLAEDYIKLPVKSDMK
jgi:hypothetical protein